MNEVHQKIIDAVIRKAKQVCPESLLLIGVYGSAATGDMHPKSDLDLLILIRDEQGRQLAEGFILADAQIGYDIYCTTWDMLEEDAKCNHAHLSKLLDSKILYVNDPSAVRPLEELRNKARGILASDQRKENAQAAFDAAKARYADCFLTDSLSGIRTSAGAAIHCLLDALMLHHGRYFHMGVKRTFEEVSTLKLPFDLEELVTAVIRGESGEEIRSALTKLMRCVNGYLHTPISKDQPAPSNLRGTYEEMFSNWRNKMEEAADREDLFSSYMNMVSLQFMLQEIAAGVNIQELDVMGAFDSGNLEKNTEAFDSVLQQYREEYRKAGTEPEIIPNIEAFLAQY